MDFYQSHLWNNAMFPFIYNKTAALQHSSVPHFNINIYICCIVAPYVSDVQLISCDIKKKMSNKTVQEIQEDDVSTVYSWTMSLAEQHVSPWPFEALHV